MIARYVAFGVFALSLAALVAQYIVLPNPSGALTVAQRLWIMAGYFTVLTNVLVAGHMCAVSFGWRISASRAAGLLISICVVGIIYHLVLAALWNPVGLAWWANQGLHTVVPMAFAAWWLAFAEKSISLRCVPEWLIWPLVYGVYAIVRGTFTGFWPYPFLDVGRLGGAQVAMNLAGLLFGFAVLGLMVLGVAKSVHACRQPDNPS